MTRLLATAAMIAALASPLAAQQNCFPREFVLERLAEKYGETRQSIGLTLSDSVVEVFASLETGTWTIVVTDTNGITCPVSSGSHFEVLNETLPVEGDPT